MEPLQPSSIKISKAHRKTDDYEKKYLCGGCSSTYKSYPALYLHIKRKHNGIRPTDTKICGLKKSGSKEKIQIGRPQKPRHDVDDIPGEQIHLEEAQSDLYEFLGGKLRLVSALNSKPTFECIIEKIIKTPNMKNNEAMIQLQKQVENLFHKLKEGNDEPGEIELDLDTLPELDKTDCLNILSWFLLWLGRNIVRPDTLGDLTIIFSTIWTVIVQKQIEIQDLDNKLVWNGVTRQCESVLSLLTCFERKRELVHEFVCKFCHLVGKFFEE